MRFAVGQGFRERCGHAGSNYRNPEKAALDDNASSTMANNNGFSGCNFIVRRDGFRLA